MNGPIPSSDRGDDHVMTRCPRVGTTSAQSDPELQAMAGRRACPGAARVAVFGSLLVAVMAGPSASHAQAAPADPPRRTATGQNSLQLNHGARWPADAALSEGMQRIRAVALWMQHTQVDGVLSARQSRAAARSIESSVAAIVEHPSRGAAVDANLHLLLGRILSADGLPQLLDALELYPRYFNDPGWRPMERNAAVVH